METFDIKLGFSCNNDCIHCVVADKRDSGTLSVLKVCRIIDSAPKDSALQITGGEPTMYSELPAILRHGKEKGHFIVIQTNGTGFADESFANECLPYIDHVHMAIHSYSEEVHDRIVGTTGMWRKTMKGFERVADSSVILTTQTVLSKVNIATLYDTFSFIQEKRPKTRMSMTYPHLMGNAWHNRKEVAFRYSEHRDEITRTLEGFAPYIFTEAIPPCYLHPFADKVASTAEKEILMGASHRSGIDFSQGECTQNYNLNDLQCHRKAPRCRECIYDKRCMGVWKEYIELFKDRLDLYPVKEE